MSLGFEWNDRKARSNLQKHGVGFVEAASVFSDPLARIFADKSHSTGELCEIIIGHAIMKKTSPAKGKQPAELAPEYRFEYGKAKPNRFAKRARPESIAVLLDPDVANVFETGEAVNAVLRAVMAAMPAGRGSSHR